MSARTDAPEVCANGGCVACGCTSASMRLALDERHRVMSCERCQVWYLDPRPTAAELQTEYARIHAQQSWGRPRGWRKRWRDRVWDAHGACRKVSVLWKLVPRGALSLILARDDGARVLDVGFGRGVLLEDLRMRGFEVWGLEVSHAAVARARAFGYRAHVASIEHADTLHELPLAAFDAVVLNHVLEHLAQPAAALLNCRRLLKHSGRLVIAIPNADAFAFAMFGREWFGTNLPHHLAFYTLASVCALVERSGFVVDDVRGKSLLWHGPQMIAFYWRRARSWSARLRFLSQLVRHCVPGRLTGCETITLYCRVR